MNHGRPCRRVGFSDCRQNLFCITLLVFSVLPPCQSVAGALGGGIGGHSYHYGGHDGGQHRSQVASKSRNNEIDLGTTLIAIRYKGGVVVAADSRTSISGYVSHRFAQKIHPIIVHSSSTPTTSLTSPKRCNCVILRSGSAADTQQLVSECSQFVQSRDYLYNGGIQGTLSVSQIAHWLRKQIRGDNGDSNSDNRELQVSLIVAGVDNHPTRTGRILTLFSNGALLDETETGFAVSGSGSSYIMGFLQQEVARLSASESSRELSQEQAITLCRKAIEGGIQWDGASGGLVRMFVLSSSSLSGNEGGGRHETIMEERVIYPDVNKKKEMTWRGNA